MSSLFFFSFFFFVGLLVFQELGTSVYIISINNVLLLCAIFSCVPAFQLLCIASSFFFFRRERFLAP